MGCDPFQRTLKRLNQGGSAPDGRMKQHHGWNGSTVNAMPVFADSERAFLRAQSGPAAGMSLCALPSSPQTRIESQLFWVLLLRRLRLPLPPCFGLVLLDNSGHHHRASCGQAGVLRRRGFEAESAVARICELQMSTCCSGCCKAMESAPIQSCFGQVAKPGWWCWQVR